MSDMSSSTSSELSLRQCVRQRQWLCTQGGDGGVSKRLQQCANVVNILPSKSCLNYTFKYLDNLNYFECLIELNFSL